MILQEVYEDLMNRKTYVDGIIFDLNTEYHKLLESDSSDSLGDLVELRYKINKAAGEREGISLALRELRRVTC